MCYVRIKMGGRSIDRHASIIIKKNSGLRFAMMARMIADDFARRNLIEKFLPPFFSFSKSHRPVVGGFKREKKANKKRLVAENNIKQRNRSK